MNLLIYHQLYLTPHNNHKNHNNHNNHPKLLQQMRMKFCLFLRDLLPLESLRRLLPRKRVSNSLSLMVCRILKCMFKIFKKKLLNICMIQTCQPSYFSIVLRMKHINGTFNSLKIRYEDLIHFFLYTFRYNIAEKVYFKYLYKIKQLPNQSIRDFIKVWK